MQHYTSVCVQNNVYHSFVRKTMFITRWISFSQKKSIQLNQTLVYDADVCDDGPREDALQPA